MQKSYANAAFRLLNCPPCTWSFPLPPPRSAQRLVLLLLLGCQPAVQPLPDVGQCQSGLKGELHGQGVPRVREWMLLQGQQC